MGVTMAITQKQNTQIQLERQGKKKKNTKHHKTTTYGSEPTNPIKKKIQTWIHKSNQEVDREKYCVFET